MIAWAWNFKLQRASLLSYFSAILLCNFVHRALQCGVRQSNCYNICISYILFFKYYSFPFWAFNMKCKFYWFWNFWKIFSNSRLICSEALIRVSNKILLQSDVIMLTLINKAWSNTGNYISSEQAMSYEAWLWRRI